MSAEMSEGNKKWYVVYTKPRWEKKVYDLLAKRGREVYCPLNRVRKKWSDRVKWIEEPLFKSYLFIRTEENGMADIRMVSGVLNFVYWLGKPAIVKDREIEQVRKFLAEYDNVIAEPLPLQKDSTVMIRQGVLMDKQAKVIKVMNKKVRVVIESIGYSLVATISRSNVMEMGSVR
jgi:transcription antitermination factor NusG